MNELSPTMTILDPWNGEYVIECTAEGVFVRSAGPDRVLGSADDVSVGPGMQVR